MFDIENVSSPFAVRGSDTDWTVYVGPGDWDALVGIFREEDFGSMVRPGVWRVEPQGDVEVFICTSGLPYDDLSRTVAENVHTMKSWERDTKDAYLREKLAIQDLAGSSRKAAKARIAEMFNLNPKPYERGM